MSETIEERYEKAKELMEGDIAELFIIHLLDDLMAERGKMKEKIAELERQISGKPVKMWMGIPIK